VALPADSLARREAADSNSVWEPPELASRLRADAQQQASLRQAREMLHGARPQARVREASRQQQELAGVARERVDAQPAVLRRPGLPREKSLRVPQVEQQRALKSRQEELAQRALPRRRSQEARRDGSARQQQEREAPESQQEAQVQELPQRASCEPLWLPLLSRPYPLLPSVRPVLPLRQARESARAPLPRLPLRSNWNASFSR